MNFKETKERMYNQKLYYCNDESLLSEQMKQQELLRTRPSEG